LRKRSGSWKLLIDPVSTSPLIFREPQPERDGILLAGDTAGFVDPFAGDGISLALRSGAMAANSLMPFFGGQVSLGQAVRQYRNAYERSLLPVFRASSQIRRLLTLPRPARRPLLLVLEKSPRIVEYLVRRTR
jgi:menaquinone-9 beta-reductase